MGTFENSIFFNSYGTKKNDGDLCGMHLYNNLSFLRPYVLLINSIAGISIFIIMLDYLYYKIENDFIRTKSIKEMNYNRVQPIEEIPYCVCDKMSDELTQEYDSKIEEFKQLTITCNSRIDRLQRLLVVLYVSLIVIILLIILIMILQR